METRLGPIEDTPLVFSDLGVKSLNGTDDLRMQPWVLGSTPRWVTTTKGTGSGSHVSQKVWPKIKGEQCEKVCERGRACV